jgi:hypothetical protein
MWGQRRDEVDVNQMLFSWSEKKKCTISHKCSCKQTESNAKQWNVQTSSVESVPKTLVRNIRDNEQTPRHKGLIGFSLMAANKLSTSVRGPLFFLLIFACSCTCARDASTFKVMNSCSDSGTCNLLPLSIDVYSYRRLHNGEAPHMMKVSFIRGWSPMNIHSWSWVTCASTPPCITYKDTMSMPIRPAVRQLCIFKLSTYRAPAIQGVCMLFQRCRKLH